MKFHSPVLQKYFPDQSCILRAVSRNGNLLTGSSKQRVAEAFIPFASLRSRNVSELLYGLCSNSA